MACKRGNTTAKLSAKRVEETNNKLNEILPKTTNGIPVYEVERIRSFLYGTTYQIDQGIGKVLLEGDPNNSNYWSSFQEVLGRLFTPEELETMYDNTRKEWPKNSFLVDNEYVTYEKATDAQLSKHIAHKFFEYAAKGGVPGTKLSLDQKLAYRFIYQWFTNLSNNAAVYNSSIVGSAGSALNKKFSIKEGKVQSKDTLTQSQAFYINEGMGALVFKILGDQNINILELIEANNPELNSAIYGDPSSYPTEDTVYDALMKYLIDEYKAIGEDWADANERYGPNHHKTKTLEKEGAALDALININPEGTYSVTSPGYIGRNWKSLIADNLEFLQKYDLNLDVLKEDPDAARDDESEVNDDEATRDKLSILSDHKTNPLKRMKNSVKILLRTLPSVSHKKAGTENSYVYNRNKLGLPKLVDFGTVFATLYNVTSNKSNELEVIRAIQMLALEDKTYQVLLNRLGLPNGVDSLEGLSERQLDVFLDFYAAMSNAQNSYEMMYITPQGGRGTIDANRDSASNIIKSKWAENFKSRVRINYGKTDPVTGRIVLDFAKTYKSGGFETTIKKRLETAPTDLDQAFTILNDLLGIEFTNQSAVKDKIFEDQNANEVLSNISSLLFYLSKNETADLFSTDQRGRLKTLVDLELATNIKSGSLQINSPSGKIYSITKKGFVNILVDEYNNPESTLLAQLEQSPTFFGSVWGDALKAGVKLKVGVILGANESLYGANKEYSKMTGNDLAVMQVNQALEGKVPLIRTGNKKLEKTLYLDQPADLQMTVALMAARKAKYLMSEIMTANAIYHGSANSIKGMEDGKSLQYFSDPSYEALHAQANMFITQTNLDEKALAEWVNNPNTLKTLVDVINQDVARTLEELVNLNVFQLVGDNYINIGIHDNHLKAVNRENKIRGVVEGSTINKELAQRIAELVYFQRTTSHIEQFKLILGHPAAFGKNLLKRTSGFVGPKTMPAHSDQVLDHVERYYPNLGNPNRYKDGRSLNQVRMMTRVEPVRTSKYLNDYVGILKLMGRDDLVPALESAYTDMEISDGGGFVHIDFYRRVRILTGSWNPKLEITYRKIINNEVITPDEIAYFDPLKPQVVAPFLEDNIHVSKFDKFALFPIHPNLTKTVSQLRDGVETDVDRIYADMNKHNLDYMSPPSVTKVGAKMEGDNFAQYFDANEEYVSIPDNPTSVVSYDLKYFGMQIDPKGKFEEKVTLGSQASAMLPSNIYSNGEVSSKYAGLRFEGDKTFEDEIDEYHALNRLLIDREAMALADKLGFTYDLDGNFTFLGSRARMKYTLIDEMTRREVADDIKDSIYDLFDRSVTYAGQLFTKDQIETLFNAIVSNTVIRRQMRGDMMVLQSNLGYEVTNKAVKLKDSGYDGQLKSYSKKGKTLEEKRKSPTIGMEVYLPHRMKHLEGLRISAGDKISVEALEAVGFRIPTEGLNSIEYIIIKDFLPPEAGNNIIVPNEIVAKSGADFDIDKLTIYLPHIEVAPDGSIQLLSRIPVTLAGMARLRTEDPNAYRTMLYSIGIDPVNLRGAIREFNRLLRDKDEGGLMKFDAKFYPQVLQYTEEDDSIMQSKAVLQNQLLRKIIGILKHPASFDQLITPVGAYTLEKDANEIHEIKTKDKPVPESTLKNMLGFEALIDTTLTMYQTLAGVGIVASGLAHHNKSQRAGLRFNPNKMSSLQENTETPIVFKFEDFINAPYISLSRNKTMDGENWINKGLQQWVTGFVDAEANPFVMLVNGGIAGAPVHMLLVRVGLDPKTGLFFMSQPIMDEFIKNKSRQQGMALSVTRKNKSDQKIVKQLIKSWGGNTSNTMFSKQSLRDNLTVTRGSSVTQKQQQVQVLKDFMRYKEYAEALRKLQSVTSYDKVRFKNGSEVIYIAAMEQIVREDGYFVNEDKIISDSMLDSSYKVFGGLQSLFKNVDFKNSDTRIREFFVNKAAELIREGKYKDDILYTLNRFDNFVMTYIAQHAKINGVPIYEMAKDLFQGNESLPKLIARMQQSGEVDNLALDNLLPMPDGYDSKSYYATVDRLRLISKKYDVYDTNALQAAMVELRSSEPDIYYKLQLFSMLQSGLDFNPNAFYNILPGSDILDITEAAFEESSLDPYFNDKLSSLWKSFMQNNYANGRIVHQTTARTEAQKSTILKEAFLPSELGSVKAPYPKWIAVRTYDKDENQSNRMLFKLVDGVYVNQVKKGLGSGTLIETGPDTQGIVTSNIKNVKYTLANWIGIEVAEKIKSGKARLIFRDATQKDMQPGAYQLRDGTSFVLSTIKGTMKKLDRLLKDTTLLNSLGINAKTDKQKIANLAEALGMDVESFRKKYPKFFTNDQAFQFFNVERRNISPELLEDAYAELKNQANPELENSVEENLEQINNCE